MPALEGRSGRGQPPRTPEVDLKRIAAEGDAPTGSLTLDDLAIAARPVSAPAIAAVQTRRWPIGLGVAVAVVALVFGLHTLRADILVLTCVPVALALAIPAPATVVWRLVVAGGAFICSNAVLALLAGGLGLPYTVPVAAAAHLAPLAFLVLTQRVTLRVGALADAGDLAALSAGVLVLLLLAQPAAGADAAHLFALVVGGEDNAAHLAMVNAIGLDNRYLFFDAAAAGTRVFEAYTTYPAGLHMNIALVLAGINDTLGGAGTGRLLRVFFAAGLVIQAAWATTTVMAARAVAGRGRRLLVPSITVAWAVVLVFAFGPPAATVRFGFQPQAASLWMLTLALLAAAAPELEGRARLRLGLVALAFAGTSWCWYMVLPVTGCIGLATVIQHRTELLRRPWSSLAIVGLGVGAAVPPLYLSLHAGAAGAVNAAGGVYALDPIFLLVLVTLSGGLLAVNAHFPNANGRVCALVALGAALLLSGVLLAYQLRTLGSGGYYYQKSLYSVFMIAVVAGGACLLTFLGARRERAPGGPGRQFAILAISLLAAWGVTGVLTPSNPGKLYLAGSARHPDPPELQQLLIDGRHPGRLEIVWSSSANPVYDYYASRFASALTLRETRGRLDLIVGAAFGQDPARLLAYVRATPAGVTVITRDPNLRASLVSAGFTEADLGRVTIELVGGDLDVGPITHSGDISIRRVLRSVVGKGVLGPA